jgi:hypothetical protein
LILTHFFLLVDPIAMTVRFETVSIASVSAHFFLPQPQPIVAQTAPCEQCLNRLCVGVLLLTPYTPNIRLPSLTIDEQGQ